MVGVVGLNSVAAALGLKLVAAALRVRGEAKGDEGADVLEATLLAVLRTLPFPWSCMCEKGSRCCRWAREGDCGPKGDGEMGLMGVVIPARLSASVEAAMALLVWAPRLNEEERDMPPDFAGPDGELKICPVGCTSSRCRCSIARAAASRSASFCVGGETGECVSVSSRSPLADA